MPHLFLKILVPTAALATFAVGSTIAWSNNMSLKGDLVSRGELVSRNPVTQNAPAIPDFDAAFASRTRKADREVAPSPATKEVASRPATPIEFSQAFADASATPRRHNTPANREKLRNAGWTRVVASQ